MAKIMKKVPRLFLIAGLLIAQIISQAGCSQDPNISSGSKLRVLATTSIIEDIVEQVGGDLIDLTVLMPVGSDPHDFQPRPQDIVAISQVQLIFANGVGLEPFLQPLLVGNASPAEIVELSRTLTLLPVPGNAQGEHDPHTWLDPNNVIQWTQEIALELSRADPINATKYQVNAEIYVDTLKQLDSWIQTEVEQVPESNRRLISDHAVLGYFANQYGFTLEGTITGSASSEAAPSAQQLAALEDRARQVNVRAVFYSEQANKVLAEQVANDLGIQAVWIYHASLSAPDGPAATYIEFMHYNVSAITGALK
jgi:manganese/iron transport system substrate-binding protein